MTDHQNNMETIVEALLAKEKNPSPSKIRELIDTFRHIYKIDDDTSEKLARDFEVRHGVTMTIGTILKEPQFKPWLENAKTSINPYYWNRYEKLLTEKRFTGQIIATLDNVTDRILGLLENPQKDGSWDRRGMVVGHVQSGKTANYTGLICKAADAGYKLIIVIAGIHNNLRNQTQSRIDEGFVGRDSTQLRSGKVAARSDSARHNDIFIGVGRFDSTRRPVTFTTSKRDFNRQTAENIGLPLQNLSEPAIFVIKKNSNSLKNLLDWLREHSVKHGKTVEEPMLLIDDEADNASINIKYGKDEVSRINGQIRDLLKLFERSCYVGYTATPFANIFIDPDSDDEMIGEDLFPRHFIVSLDPPTNYFGANKVFLDESDFIRHIDDNEDHLPLIHSINTNITGIPESLKRAIRTFIVAKAIRLARNHKNIHCSMLVNASRFTGVQKSIRNLIHEELTDIQASVRVNGALPVSEALKDSEISALKKVWEEEYCSNGVDWSVIQNLLHEAVAPIKVVEVNSRSSGTLNYTDFETGLSIIAVGGFSLSRGLTLEGLMVSYFLRNSVMYDTLMQMGRWFGYRPGYEDLCRIWMPEETEGWYSHIAESIEILRDELRKMEAVNATPEEFGLKVRSHPDTLIVTARNKMGSGERVVVNIGLGNSFIETATLKRDQATIKENKMAVERLVKNLKTEGNPIQNSIPVSGGWLLCGVSVNPILTFLSEFENHPGSVLTETGPVRRYIEERQDSELEKWDILFAGIDRQVKNAIVDTSLGISIKCQQRTAGKKSDSKTLYITNKQRVASRGVEKIGLTKEEIQYAEQEFEKYNSGNGSNGQSLNYPDWIYRVKRQRPLVIIHLLKITNEEGIQQDSEPVVAWSISFPTTKLDEKRVEYVVNTRWYRENFGDDFEEEEIGGDNE